MAKFGFALIALAAWSCWTGSSTAATPATKYNRVAPGLIIPPVKLLRPAEANTHNGRSCNGSSDGRGLSGIRVTEIELPGGIKVVVE